MKKLLLGLSIFLSFSLAWAAKPPPVGDGGILPGPTSAEMETNTNAGTEHVVDKLLPGLSSAFTVTMFLIGIAMIIVAGVIFIVSSGDSEMRSKAKNIIIWTIVGVIVAILSVAVVKFVTRLNLYGI